LYDVVDSQLFLWSPPDTYCHVTSTMIVGILLAGLYAWTI